MRVIIVRVNSPLIKSICYERLHSTQASFSTEIDLNVATGHDFGQFQFRALPASNSLVLATTDFFNGLLIPALKTRFAPSNAK